MPTDGSPTAVPWVGEFSGQYSKPSLLLSFKLMPPYPPKSLSQIAATNSLAAATAEKTAFFPREMTVCGDQEEPSLLLMRPTIEPPSFQMATRSPRSFVANAGSVEKVVSSSEMISGPTHVFPPSGLDQ